MIPLIFRFKITQPIGLYLSLFCLSFSVLAQPHIGKTEVLILGTAHLNQIKDFKPSMLNRLTKRLDSLSFDAVCIENMPAELLYDIRSREDDAFSDVLTYFGGDRLSIADSIQKHLDIGFLDAQKKRNELIDKKQFSDEEHLSLIEYALAAADPVTAALHYTQLEDKKTLQQSKLPRKYYDELISELDNPNEIYSLALRLASIGGLSRLEYIDNFQDEALLFKHFPNFIEEYTNNEVQFQGIGDLPIFEQSNAILQQCIEKNDLHDYYRFLNSEEYMTQDSQAQWQIWLKTNFPSGADRARYYLWEMRNLEIAANITKVCALYPGKRIVVIIGASHKSFIEKYLNQISNIELMDFN